MTVAPTYEIDLQDAAWRVEQDVSGTDLYCVVVAKTPQEAAEIALDITGDTVTRVAGPYRVKPNTAYLNRP